MKIHAWVYKVTTKPASASTKVIANLFHPLLLTLSGTFALQLLLIILVFFSYILSTALERTTGLVYHYAELNHAFKLSLTCSDSVTYESEDDLK